MDLKTFKMCPPLRSTNKLSCLKYTVLLFKKKEGKVVRIHARKEWQRSEVQGYSTLISAPGGGRAVSIMLWPIYLREKLRVPIQ